MVGIKPFFSTVFKYSFVLLFKSNFTKSILKSPVIMLCLIPLLLSIFDKEFSKCSVNSFTSPLRRCHIDDSPKFVLCYALEIFPLLTPLFQ